MIDYALWDVIGNGLSLLKTQVVEGVTTLMPITFVEDKDQRRLEVKARSTLMIGIHNEHQLKFNSIKDAKQLMEAIKKRFEVKEMSGLNSSTQNMAFVFSSNNNNTNKAVNTAQGVNTTLRFSTSTTQVNNANIDNLIDAIIYAFLASQPSIPQLTIRFDKTNIECYNCHKRRHFARECKAPRSQDTKKKESIRRTVPMETPASTALVSCDGLGSCDWSHQAKEGLDEFDNKPAVENYDAKTSETKPKDVRKNNDAPIIKEWVSDDEDEEEVTQPKIEQKKVKPSIPKIKFVKPKQPEKKARKTVKHVEKPRQNTHRPRGNQRN
nr:hypothetical protein [Tanacetum cinerariifolium]